MNGPAKLTAIMANDLAQAGHKVSIFIPILPYYYYFVVIGLKVFTGLKDPINKLERGSFMEVSYFFIDNAITV